MKKNLGKTYMVHDKIEIKLAVIGLLLFMLGCKDSRVDDAGKYNIAEVYNNAKNEENDARAIVKLRDGIDKYNPTKDYEDAMHIRFYRLMKYELAFRLAIVGEKDKSREVFNWLISTDYYIK